MSFDDDECVYRAVVTLSQYFEKRCTIRNRIFTGFTCEPISLKFPTFAKKCVDVKHKVVQPEYLTYENDFVFVVKKAGINILKLILSDLELSKRITIIAESWSPNCFKHPSPQRVTFLTLTQLQFNIFDRPDDPVVQKCLSKEEVKIHSRTYGVGKTPNIKRVDRVAVYLGGEPGEIFQFLRPRNIIYMREVV